jgi:hypothetical protein
MMSWLASLLASPILNTLSDGWRAYLNARLQGDAQAADLAKATIAAETEARKRAVEMMVAEQGTWFTRMPRAIVQWSFALFVAKCVIWDNLLQLGNTDPLGGQVGEWAGWVMALWFGGRSLEKIAATIAQAVRR